MYRVATTINHSSVTGIFVERFGYRPFLLGALCYLYSVVAIFFCAPTTKILLLVECLADVAFGFFMPCESTDIGFVRPKVLSCFSCYLSRERGLALLLFEAALLPG